MKTDKKKKKSGKVKDKNKAAKKESTAKETEAAVAQDTTETNADVLPLKKGHKPPEIKKEKPIPDTNKNLPEHAKEKMIICREVGHVEPTKVKLSSITATTKCIHVDNIHSANPIVLQTIYWIIMPDSRIVVARVTKDEYEYILNARKDATHLMNVVDCAVTPTLTYGSWKVNDIKGELPSVKQIEAEDAKFEDNPTLFHNPPVKVTLEEDDEEEDFILDDEEEDDEEAEEWV